MARGHPIKDRIDIRYTNNLKIIYSTNALWYRLFVGIYFESKHSRWQIHKRSNCGRLPSGMSEVSRLCGYWLGLGSTSTQKVLLFAKTDRQTNSNNKRLPLWPILHWWVLTRIIWIFAKGQRIFCRKSKLFLCISDLPDAILFYLW